MPVHWPLPPLRTAPHSMHCFALWACVHWPQSLPGPDSFAFYWGEVNLKTVLVSSILKQPLNICIYILFQILFHYRLLQDIEYSVLSCVVGHCYLSILYSSVYMLIPPPPPHTHTHRSLSVPSFALTTWVDASKSYYVLFWWLFYFSKRLSLLCSFIFSSFN